MDPAGCTPKFGHLRLVLFILICVVAISRTAAAAATPPLEETAVRTFSDKSSAKDAQSPGAAAPGMDYSRVLGALAVVLGLIFFLKWCSRYFLPSAGGRRASGAVEVIARAPISPRQQIMLIRVGRRLIVVGDSGAQMNPLCELSDADEVAALVGQVREERIAPARKAFGAVFGRSRRGFDGADPSDAAEALIDEGEDGEPVDSARQEIDGLRERVRLLAQQFKGT